MTKISIKWVKKCHKTGVTITPRLPSQQKLGNTAPVEKDPWIIGIRGSIYVFHEKYILLITLTHKPEYKVILFCIHHEINEFITLLVTFH